MCPRLFMFFVFKVKNLNLGLMSTKQLTVNFKEGKQ